MAFMYIVYITDIKIWSKQNVCNVDQKYFY